MAKKKAKPKFSLPSPNWDLEKDGISYSLLSKWINCRERARIYAVEGLAPVSSTDSIDFGTIFHFLIEKAAEHNNDMTIVTRLYKKWARKNQRILGEEGELGEIAWYTFQAYMDFYKKDDVGKKQYLYSEENFRETFTLPSGRKIDLRGKWDQVYQQGKGIWLQENKTKSRYDPITIQAWLPHDLQVMIYLSTIQLRIGKTPTGVLYNVIRKYGQRRGVKETVPAFAKRIKKDIDSRPEHYFFRCSNQITAADLAIFQQRTLFPHLEQLWDWWESIRHNPFDPWTLPDGTPNRLHWQRPFGLYDSFRYGKGEYFDLITRGIRAGLQRIGTPFPELEED